MLLAAGTFGLLLVSNKPHQPDTLPTLAYTRLLGACAAGRLSRKPSTETFQAACYARATWKEESGLAAAGYRSKTSDDR